MRHEIESYFEPDIAWLGEINRRALWLEREAGALVPPQSRLRCALWRGRDGRAGVNLTLCAGDAEVCGRGEDPSPVAATRLAFQDLYNQVSARAASEGQAGSGLWAGRVEAGTHYPRQAGPYALDTPPGNYSRGAPPPAPLYGAGV